MDHNKNSVLTLISTILSYLLCSDFIYCTTTLPSLVSTTLHYSNLESVIDAEKKLKKETLNNYKQVLGEYFKVLLASDTENEIKNNLIEKKKELIKIEDNYNFNQYVLFIISNINQIAICLKNPHSHDNTVYNNIILKDVTLADGNSLENIFWKIFLKKNVHFVDNLQNIFYFFYMLYFNNIKQLRKKNNSHLKVIELESKIKNQLLQMEKTKKLTTRNYIMIPLVIFLLTCTYIFIYERVFSYRKLDNKYIDNKVQNESILPIENFIVGK